MPDSQTDTPANLVIYGSPVSPFVRKVAAVCIEKGLRYEIEGVDVFNPPEWFLDISPMKRIPVLRDRSLAESGPAGTIADSSAICAYIEAKHPDTPVYPLAAFDHGKALEFEEYADTILAATGGLGIFRPLFFAVTQGKEPDVARAQETWADKMPPVLGYLDKALDGRDCLVGEGVTIADISTTACLMQLALVAQFDMSRWPSLKAHYDRMAARPSIAGPFGAADRFVRKAMPERVVLG